METFWWCVTIALMLIGLAGTLLPLIPGTILIFGGAVIGHFMLGAIGWPMLAVLFAFMALAQVLDFVSGSLGAKWFGASRWGAIGGLLGAIVGLFFGLIGIFIGPLIGALLGELLGGKGLLPAGKSSWGTFVGTTAGMMGKLLIGVAMISLFFCDAFLF